MNRLDPFDALRVFAMTIVLASHIWGTSPYHFILGSTGVIMFFALSGYQIGKGFYSGRYTAKDYLIKRFFAVGLPYLVFVIFAALVIYPGMITDDPITVVRLLTFTYSGEMSSIWLSYGMPYMGHLWFISVMMQMYLIALVLGLVVSKVKHNTKICWILFLGFLVLGELIRSMYYHMGISIYFSILNYVNVFFCAFMLRYLNLPTDKAGHAVKICSTIVLIAVAVCNLDRFIWVTLALFVFFLVLDSNVRNENERLSVSAVKRNPLRIIECLSMISLSFYMWHQVVIWKIWGKIDLGADIWGYTRITLIAFAVTCLAGALWYLSVERASKNLASRLRTTK